MLIFIWKKGKIHLKMCKSSIYKIFFPCLYIQLYITKVPIGSGSGENFPDPTQKIRIRFRIWIRNPHIFFSSCPYTYSHIFLPSPYYAFVLLSFNYPTLSFLSSSVLDTLPWLHSILSLIYPPRLSNGKKAWRRERKGKGMGRGRLTKCEKAGWSGKKDGWLRRKDKEEGR